MTLANWSVVPSLKPWRGDRRRNVQPYYIGKGMSLSEFAYVQWVKRELESRGIDCRCELVDVKEGES